MAYTLEEQKTINKGLDTILKDLELIWESAGKEDIEISIRLKGIKKENVKYPTSGWQFFLTKDGFYINNKLIENKIYFTTIDETGKMKTIYGMYELTTIFIKEYPKLRERIINKITKIKEEKNKTLEKIANIQKLYSNTSDIEIDFAQTQNRHKIEVTEENGKKIGTINFGSQSIRIITEGNIILVDKKESSKTKRIKNN